MGWATPNSEGLIPVPKIEKPELPPQDQASQSHQAPSMALPRGRAGCAYRCRPAPDPWFAVDAPMNSVCVLYRHYDAAGNLLYVGLSTDLAKGGVHHDAIIGLAAAMIAGGLIVRANPMSGKFCVYVLPYIDGKLWKSCVGRFATFEAAKEWAKENFDPNGWEIRESGFWPPGFDDLPPLTPEQSREYDGRQRAFEEWSKANAISSLEFPERVAWVKQHGGRHTWKNEQERQELIAISHRHDAEMELFENEEQRGFRKLCRGTK